MTQRPTHQGPPPPQGLPALPSFPPLPNPADVDPVLVAKRAKEEAEAAAAAAAGAGQGYRPRAWEYVRDLLVVGALASAPWWGPWVVRWVRGML